MKRSGFADRVEARRARALARQVERASRSDKDQLALLYARGVTHGREWDRLTRRAATAKAAAKAKEEQQLAVNVGVCRFGQEKGQTAPQHRRKGVVANN